MPIYLHELVNTVPTRSENYLDSMAEHHGSNRKLSGKKDTMLGLWTVLEANGTWPLAVNLWQHEDWDDEANDLVRQFEPKAQDPKLKEWWLGNLNLRTGGFDRLLESTDYSLDVAGLRSRSVGGKLFLHQIVRLRPGTVDEYLDAFGESALPALEGAGAQLVGAYRVRLYNDEAITIFAFRERSDFARYLKAWHEGAGSEALGRWRVQEDRWVREKETLLMKPRYFLDSPWHP
jgi:hypothetical protein